MRLVAYLRVSSDGQADGYGIDVQRKAVRAWAKANGHRIVDELSDTARGTTDALDRPVLTQALQMLRTQPTGDGRHVRQADGLVVAKLDRLARALTVQEAALALAWRLGASVFTADTGEVHAHDPDDPMRTAMRQMMGVFAELDRNTLVKRMRDGIRAKAATGRKATGSYPYGYRRGDGKGRDLDAAPDPSEQAAVEVIVRLRGGGASYREVVAALNAAGHRPKRAQQWLPMTVKRVYDRETARSSA